MWNKLSLRFRITLVTALALSIMAVGITASSIYNARQNMVLPLQLLEFTGIQRGIVMVPQEELMTVIGRNDGQEPLIQTISLNPELLRAENDFVNFSIIIALGFVLLGTGVAYIISGQLLKPIKELAHKMEDIDANHLHIALDTPKATDEIASLTHSFNNMIIKLNTAFEVQKQFAQNAAHELKTPLTSIRSNIEVLELDDQPTVDEYKEAISFVKGSTERLVGLVEGLLSFSKDSSKIIDVAIDGSWLFENIIKTFSREIAEKQLLLKIDGEAHLQGDVTLLEQAFTNLVSNAIRYNVNQGNIWITLSPERIVIEDSGIGIPFKDLKHIFEPFYCVDASRSKNLGGHGLGLAISKNILEKHNYEIQVFSKPGKGTKVIVDLISL